MKTNPHKDVESLMFLAEDPDLLLGIVFGSSVEGKSRPDSDIDVAVYPRSALDRRKLQEIADSIAMSTGRTVDLIDLSNTDGALLRQILTTGIVIFAKRPGILGLLTERLLGWQEDFEPHLNELLESRLHRFTTLLHES